MKQIRRKKTNVMCYLPGFYSGQLRLRPARDHPRNPTKRTPKSDSARRAPHPSLVGDCP